MLAALSAAFVLTSPAFHAGGTIPKAYTCDGANGSPPLRWTAPPRGTARLTLTVTDPDAPGAPFLHWRVLKISPKLRGLPAGSRLGAANSLGRLGYTGPCPPAGPAHHYVFILRALDPHGRVLARASLVGLYRRR